MRTNTTEVEASAAVQRKQQLIPVPLLGSNQKHLSGHNLFHLLRIVASSHPPKPMPRKGMRCLLFPIKAPTLSGSKFSSLPSSPSSRLSFSESVMDRTLKLVEPLIMKWDPDTTSFARVTSLFHDNRREARDFIKHVDNIQRAMQLLATENSSSQKLDRAQILMQTAMKRLQKEFYQILSMNRAYLDPESVSARSSLASIRSSFSEPEDDDNDNLDEVRLAGETIAEVEDVSSLAMADLRTIAECMISSGYAKECIKIYNIIRTSIIDEGIFKLGVEQLSSSQVRKMDWEAVDLRINNWLEAVKVALDTLFNGERILSDHVFALSESIRESCFADISRDGAMILFAFPENVVRNSKSSTYKVFRMLDVYTAISDHWPQMESIFCFESSAPVRSQAITSLIKIGEYVRSALAEFESAIQKDNSKSTVVGGGIYPLTVASMNHLSLLADYSNILTDILAGSTPPHTSSLDPYLSLSHTDKSSAPTVSRRFAWLILSLLAKIDGKAKLYRDASLSYLFLANNHQYVIVKARTSNLNYILGDDWLSKQEAKVRQLASNYERLAWGQVMESLPEDPTVSISQEQAKEKFKKFITSFEQAHRKQSSSVIPDSELRDDVKINLARKIVPVYREFYKRHVNRAMTGNESSSLVRFSPEDVERRLSGLFFGTAGATGSSSHSSSSSSHTQPSRHR